MTHAQHKSRHIVLIHPRKAGGTSLGFYIKIFLSKLDDLNIAHNITFVHREGWLRSQQNGNFIQQTLTDYPNALYIAVFRDPVERIISQYEFEWRWGCQMCTEVSYIEYINLSYNTHPNYNADNDIWIPFENEHQETTNMTNDVLKHRFSNVDFKHFMDSIEEHMHTNRLYLESHMRRLVRIEHAPIATYLNNYYLWLLCCDMNWCKVYGRKSISMTKCLMDAINIVSKFDLVLVTPWLSDHRIRMHLHKVFTDYLDSILDVEYDKAALIISMDQVEARRSNESITRGHAQMISNEIYQRLQKWNEWDKKLYTLVQNLSYQQLKIGWKSNGGYYDNLNYSYFSAGRDRHKTCKFATHVLLISSLITRFMS